MTEDEWEAVRLTDKEGLYQEQAAERMRVSRQTFWRILESARRKIADALVSGKVLIIEGGHVEPASPQTQPPPAPLPPETPAPPPHRHCRRRCQPPNQM